MRCQFGTALFEVQTFPCPGGAAPARPAGTPGSTNPPSVVLTPLAELTHPGPFTPSNSSRDEALVFPAQKISAWDSPHTALCPEPPRCWGYPSPVTQFGGHRNIPPGSSSSRGGGIFFLGSAHHVDGGKQVPGKYLPAGACGDAAFTGFTASKPRPQSLQISFHHFSRGLITPLAAGGARRSQVQPLLIAGIYYLNVDFQLLVPVPAPRVPVPPLHPKTRAP